MPAVQWGLYAGSLVPAGVALVLRRRGYVLPAGAVLFALAMAVSFAGDTVTLLGQRRWMITSVWMTAQYGLALSILLVRGERRWWWLVLIALTAVDLYTAAAPGTMVRVTGGMGVVAFASRRKHRLALPLVLYFGLGSVLYVAWVAAIAVGDPLPWWWAYQATRVAAWAAFLSILFSPLVGRVAVWK